MIKLKLVGYLSKDRFWGSVLRSANHSTFNLVWNSVHYLVWISVRNLVKNSIIDEMYD